MDERVERAQVDAAKAGNARYLAEHVRDGRHAILPGADSVIWAGDVDAIAFQIERFLL